MTITLVIHVTKASIRMLNSQFVTNDTEKTFVYEDKDVRTNLSKLVATPDDQECLSIAKYNKENGELIVEVKLYRDEQILLQKLLNP